MKRLYQGKMSTLLLLFWVTLVCGTSAVSIMPELNHDILRFGYGVILDTKVCWHTHLIDFM